MSEPSAAGYQNHPRGRATRGVRVGPLVIGGGRPIVIQSMIVSDSLDTEAVVAEVKALVAAGCPLVRLAVPSLREAENLREIRRRLEAEGVCVPLVADVHFTPHAAVLAAAIVDKVRINPGNFADRKRVTTHDYSDTQHADELARVTTSLRPLVEALQSHDAALRIGTNHGSLSDRVLSRFGDTPAGMVESALEFVRACESLAYREIVLSMKSSIPGVMIAAYRMLAARMDEAGMNYPLHLGVTEAGDGLEARVKSAIGIGSLLVDGVGDTIRVSLAEDSVHEIPAARAILDAVEEETGARAGGPDQPQELEAGTGPAWWKARTVTQPRRRSRAWVLGGLSLGGDFPVRVEARALLPVGTGRAAPPASWFKMPPGEAPEFVSVRPFVEPPAQESDLLDALDAFRLSRGAEAGPPLLLEWTFGSRGEVHLLESALPFVDGLSLAIDPPASPGDDDRFRLLARLLRRAGKPVRFRLPADAAVPGGIAARVAALCRSEGLPSVGFLCAPGPRWIERTRDLVLGLAESLDPIFLEVPPAGPLGAIRAGSMLLDGIGDALCLDPSIPATPWPAGGRTWREEPVSSTWIILQACRLRLTRAEFIVCPSCGRTRFDLQRVAAMIRERTEHLRGVKIAVMGCIVNGLGEMADADFGYVGSGPGKVDLYVGRTKVRQGVPEAEATARLVELIREHGRWTEPDPGVSTQSRA
jgi:(E)-4-hydroxy-3-methylbut-2-enyl-diphosphate synthase